MSQNSNTIQKLIKQLHRTVNKTLKDVQLFPKKARILVACSGGPDSMVLLEVLQYLNHHRKAQWSIGVTTIDHCIRSEGATELQLVENYCKARNIPFWGIKRDVPAIARARKESLETIGRYERYAWFNQLAECEGYDYIATAHHKDDQAETILAHILRGTGIKGLTGMIVVSHDYVVPLVRPLLDITKTEILEYAQLQGIAYCIDSSNEDVQYNRNRIRHEVMPVLQTINPNVVDALCRLGNIAHVDEDYIQGESRHLFSQLVMQTPYGYNISRRAMRALSLAMQRRLWQLMIPCVSLSLLHHEQLEHIVKSGEPKTFTIQKVTINAQCDTIHVYCEY
ncbi:tRNA lysidine(34) synthetase TilS [Veillonella sp.]